MSGGGGNLGAAGVLLYADTEQFKADLGKSAAVAEREMRRIQRESAMAAAIVDELSKRTSAGAQVMRQSQSHHDSASRAVREHAQQMRNLSYQMTDIVSGLSTGQSPFYVLMQQGGQLRDTFGGVRPALNAVFSLFTVGRVAALGLAGGVGLAATAMLQGAQESREFQRQIALTGNYAEITEAKLDDMAEAQARVARVGTSGQREALGGLAGTGLFRGAALEEAGRAMAQYRRLTDESAEDVVKRFQKMEDGAAKWAAEQNKSVHFLTLEQYKHIKSLEDTGRKQDAMRESAKLLADTLEQRTAPALGYLETSWKGVRDMASAAWRAMMNWGKPVTLDDELETARWRLKKAQDDYDRASRNGRTPNNPVAQTTAGELANAKATLAQLEARAALQRAGDSARAQLAEAEAKKIAKQQELDKKTPKTAEELQREYEAMVRRTLANRPETFREFEAKGYEATQRWLRDQENAIAEMAREREKVFQQWYGGFQASEADAASRRGPGGFDKGVQEAANQWWKDVEDRSRAGREAFVNNMKLMEDSIVEWARTGKISAGDLFASMGEMWLRESIRMAQKDFFFNDSGTFGGQGSTYGSLMTAIGSWFTGGGAAALDGSHAGGLSYVPYDGYRAVLHEGERVQTKQEALAGSGRGGGMAVDNSIHGLVVGPGVSLPQVAAVVEAAQQRQEVRFRRLMKQGVMG